MTARGQTALHVAAEHDKPVHVSVLLENGSHCDALDTASDNGICDIIGWKNRIPLRGRQQGVLDGFMKSEKRL